MFSYIDESLMGKVAFFQLILPANIKILMKTIIKNEKQAIEALIRECDTCYVGMADTDGTPYVIPMNFGYEDNVIYLHSAPEGRSISILERNPKVCLTFCSSMKLAYQNEQVACSYRIKGASVIAEGQVVFEEDFDEKVKALDIIMRQYTQRPFTYGAPAIRNVKIWKVAIESVCRKDFGVPYREA